MADLSPEWEDRVTSYQIWGSLMLGVQEAQTNPYAMDVKEKPKSPPKPDKPVKYTSS